MAKPDDATEDSGAADFETRIARAEMQARFYEAQIRVLEARRKLAELRKAMKSGA
ncbi:MAG TPA: hypothetical protein VIJ42_09380 [Stellaceae bacterium]